MATFANMLLLLLVCLGHDVTQVQSDNPALRPGQPTETHSCNRVRNVPPELFRPEVMRPDGLNSTFYKKYTEAYGIPILGSHNVTDDALKRACYTVRFLLADDSGIRTSFYKLGVRFAVMSSTEVTLDIPEHSHMDPHWNHRARGLGGSFFVPIVTGAEENVLCWPHDKYHPEDILLHETGHAIDTMGARIVFPGFYAARRNAFDNANHSRLWQHTYALRNSAEYFAEGMQSYFNVNTEGRQGGGGVHNEINTREELRTYDPTLYNLIRQLFPCNNTYLKRCESTRELEHKQVLRMNCNKDHVTLPKSMVDPDCPDKDPIDCIHRWSTGSCDHNRGYMRLTCPGSCDFCKDGAPTCYDSNANCRYWANVGECDRNPRYMLSHCKMSCGQCTE